MLFSPQQRNHTIHCSFCALSQYGVSFDGVGSFIIGQLRSFDVIRPRLSPPSHSRDLKIVRWWENGPIWVLLLCLCLYSAPHLVTRSIDPDFTTSGYYPIWCHRPSFVIIEPVCRVGLHTAQNVICKAPDLWAPWWLRNWGKLSFTFLGQSGAAECNSSGTGGEIDVPICGEEAPWTFS